MTDDDFEARRPGRPKIGQGAKISGRIPADLDARVEAFAAENFMKRTDAIRLLIERGLDDDRQK